MTRGREDPPRGREEPRRLSNPCWCLTIFAEAPGAWSNAETKDLPSSKQHPAELKRQTAELKQQSSSIGTVLHKPLTLVLALALLSHRVTKAIISDVSTWVSIKREQYSDRFQVVIVLFLVRPPDALEGMVRSKRDGMGALTYPAWGSFPKRRDR